MEGIVNKSMLQVVCVYTTGCVVCLVWVVGCMDVNVCCGLHGP